MKHLVDALVCIINDKNMEENEVLLPLLLRGPWSLIHGVINTGN